MAVRPPTARFDTRGTTRDSFPNSLTLIYVNKLLQVQTGVQNKVFPRLDGCELMKMLTVPVINPLEGIIRAPSSQSLG